MRESPRLLNHPDAARLPRALFRDLQMDSIISEAAIAVLQIPCDRAEILRREEFFALLQDQEKRERVKHILSVLTDLERSLMLLRDAKIPLDMYHRRRDAFRMYVRACERLTSASDLGSLFGDVAAYYSSVEKQHTVSRMKEACREVTEHLHRFKMGLLSFSDKNWLTPDYDAVSEADRIAICACKLGFIMPERKQRNDKISLALSDAMCSLYGEEVSEIETLFREFADVDLKEPLLYIAEIRFFLEIYELTQKAESAGIPHCFPEVADRPQFTAEDLYDVSLLAKQCERIVPNDADFTQAEPFCFLVGANGGGKTTYLRAIGINLVLFFSGCPVFAKKAILYPFQIVSAHFPKDERFDHVGRLDEEWARTDEKLRQSAGQDAFLLFNETYSGADDTRGFALLKELAARISTAKHFGVYVTHFHTVMTLNYPVLSAEIDPADENKRTYRIVKSKGNASSYAADILKKYGLDKDSLRERRDGYGK